MSYSKYIKTLNCSQNLFLTEDEEKKYDENKKRYDMLLLCNIKIENMYLMYTYWNNGDFKPGSGYVKNIEGIFFYDLFNNKLRACNQTILKFSKEKNSFSFEDNNEYFEKVLQLAIVQFINGVSVSVNKENLNDVIEIKIPKTRTSKINRENYEFSLINEPKAKLSFPNNNGELMYYNKDAIELQCMNQSNLQLELDF